MKKKLLISAFAFFLIFGWYAVYPQPAQANLFSDLWQSFKEQIFVPPAEKISEPVDAVVESESKAAIVEEKKSSEFYKPVADYEEAVITASETAEPAVVSIIVTKELAVIESCAGGPLSNIPPEFRQFFDLPDDYSGQCSIKRKQEVGGGSGFIVSSDGLILTNKHVVADKSASYTVITSSGDKYEARVLARDPALDLAVIKIDVSGRPTVKLGDSTTVKLGQTAIAIGNSLGEFGGTVSVGVISGLSRTITASGGAGGEEKIEGVFQTDAAINPGNSGGPLLNLKGEVIGINTAMASDAENIGFAIPINQAKRDIDSVKKSGKIVIPFLGVRYLEVDEEVAKERGLNVTHGVLLVAGRTTPAVAPGSPAEKVGLKAGDVIVAIGGKQITADASLGYLVQQHEVGEQVEIKFVRDGREYGVRARLEGREG